VSVYTITSIVVIGLLTILLRRLLSKKGVGGFTCFVIALGVWIAFNFLCKWLQYG
jgi:hypothetical protein